MQRKPIHCVTAPVITAEMERQELAAMSEAERLELRNDLMGRIVRLDKSPSEVEQGLQSMRQALAELSDNEKLEYVEAMEKVPALVASETPMELFLRTERFDAGLACQRLTSYWKTRKQFFGARRFLPMKQRGGALEKDDLIILRKQFVVLIPPDRHGRPTLWLDRARMRPDNSLPSSFVSCLALHFTRTPNHCASAKPLTPNIRFSCAACFTRAIRWPPQRTCINRSPAVLRL